MISNKFCISIVFAMCWGTYSLAQTTPTNLSLLDDLQPELVKSTVAETKIVPVIPGMLKSEKPTEKHERLKGTHKKNRDLPVTKKYVDTTLKTPKKKDEKVMLKSDKTKTLTTSNSMISKKIIVTKKDIEQHVTRKFKISDSKKKKRLAPIKNVTQVEKNFLSVRQIFNTN